MNEQMNKWIGNKYYCQIRGLGFFHKGLMVDMWPQVLKISLF